MSAWKSEYRMRSQVSVLCLQLARHLHGNATHACSSARCGPFPDHGDCRLPKLAYDNAQQRAAADLRHGKPTCARGMLQRMVRRTHVRSVRSEPTCRYVLARTPEDRALVLTSASSRGSAL